MTAILLMRDAEASKALFFNSASIAGMASEKLPALALALVAAAAGAEAYARDARFAARVNALARQAQAKAAALMDDLAKLARR